MQATNENDMKAVLLDFLLRRNAGNPDYVLANEIGFAHWRRRADIVEITDHMDAFEIKSDVDNLSKLKEQIAAYRRFFDSLTIVTTDRHIAAIRGGGYLPRGVGVWLVRNGKIREVRKPVRRPVKAFKKYDITVRIRGAEINKIARQLKMTKSVEMNWGEWGGGTFNLNYGIEAKRSFLVKKLSHAELHAAAVRSIKDQYRKAFDCFVKGKSDPVLPSNVKLFAAGWDKPGF